MKLGDFVKSATSHAESVKVSRTGITPLLWLVGLITPLAMVLAAWTGDMILRVVMLAFAVLPPLVATVAWFVLLLFRPQMLESEEYRLRQSAMRLLIDSGGEKVVDVAKEVVKIENLFGGLGEGEKK